MFQDSFSSQEFKDFMTLGRAIEEMERQPGCTMDPDMFFPEHRVRVEDWQNYLIKDVCSDCPVRLLCLDYGLKYQEDGYWGGLSPQERQKIRKRVPGKYPLAA